MPRGAQPALPSAPLKPQYPQGQGKLPSMPPLPTQTPSRDRQSHQQCPCTLQNPSTPSPTRAALFRSEYPQYQPARGGDIVSQAGGPGPCCRDKGGCRNPRWGAPGVPLTLGGLQDMHHLPDLQREVMLLGAREVPHGCGKRGWELGFLPGAPHQPPGPVHLQHPTGWVPSTAPLSPCSSPRDEAEPQPHKQHETPKHPDPTPQESHGTARTGLGTAETSSPLLALRSPLWDTPACHPHPGESCSWHKQCREARAS